MKILEIDTPSGKAIYVEIESDDGSLTTMPKSTWDELEAQREQSGTLQ